MKKCEMNCVKKSFFCFFALVAICTTVGFIIEKVHVALTDGFSVGNITSNHVDHPLWDVPMLAGSDRDEIEQALTQEYKYLGKGHQAYAFESADGRYVLKFLKFQVYSYHPIVNALPLPSSWSEALDKKLAHKGDKRDDVFRSWLLANGDLKDETGVIYIHINRKKEFDKTVQLYNKMGMSYRIPLDDYVFMVQRKAELIEKVFERSYKENRIEDGKHLLDQMLSLYISEYERGLAEKDKYIVRNTGVHDGKPMHIDTGRLSYAEELKDKSLQQPQLVWKTSVMMEWLAAEYPELADHLATRLKELE